MERAQCFVPGRIELLGKHVDYLGGRSLTCATPWGLELEATRVPGASGVVGSDATAQHLPAAKSGIRVSRRENSGCFAGLDD